MADIQRRVQAVADTHSGSRQWEPQEMVRIGGLIRDEARDRARGREAELSTQAQALSERAQAKYQEYTRKAAGVGSGDPGVQALRREYDELMIEQREAVYQLQQVTGKARLEVLNEIRPMGGLAVRSRYQGFTAEEKDTMKRDLARVSKYVPRDWITASNEHGQGSAWGRYLTIVKDHGRAYYSGGLRGDIHVAPRKVSTLLHELSHRAEDARASIVRAEQRFYTYRTEGERAKQLGAGYRADEVARKDRFRDLYMGKDYSIDQSGTGAAYFELLSMGQEALWYERASRSMDLEMESWLLALLAAA